jgi:cytidylate kinase
MEGAGNLWEAATGENRAMHRSRKLIVAIDGPVGSGKSTVARRVAELLGYTHLDSGAMYRALALKAMRKGVPLDDAPALSLLASETRIDLEPGAADAVAATRVKLDGEDVTQEIRSAEMSQAASRVAAIEGVRRPLVAEQRRAGAAGGVVMEGRDIGTAVFPEAEVKIYLDAEVEVRAERRMMELRERGEALALEEMMAEVRRRDLRDMQRAISPLRRGEDAVYVDCSAIDAEEAARLIAMLAREREQQAGGGGSGPV